MIDIIFSVSYKISVVLTQNGLIFEKNLNLKSSVSDMQ